MEGHDHVPETIDPFPDANPQSAWHEVWWPMGTGPVHLHLVRHAIRPAPGAAKMHRFLLASRRDQADLRSDPLDQCIRADGRRIHHVIRELKDRVGVEADALGRIGHSREEAD